MTFPSKMTLPTFPTFPWRVRHLGPMTFPTFPTQWKIPFMFHSPPTRSYLEMMCFWGDMYRKLDS